MKFNFFIHIICTALLLCSCGTYRPALMVSPTVVKSGPELQKLINELQPDATQTMVLERSRYHVSNLVVPPGVILHCKKDAVLVVSGKIDIYGRVEAGPSRVFDGDGVVSFHSGKTKQIYPQWWGAEGDGVNDDTVAIQKACASVKDDGVKRIIFEEGIYLVLKKEIDYKNKDNLGTFCNIDGIQLISRNAVLKIDPARTNEPRWGILFQFTDCTNVKVDGFHVEGPPLDLTKSQTGCWFLTFLGNCRHIALPFNSIKNMGCGYEFRGEKYGYAVTPEEDTSKTEYIAIGELRVQNSRYGITCMSSGNFLKARKIISNGVARSYYVSNAHDHEVNIKSRNNLGSDAWFINYRHWHRIANIVVAYENTDSNVKEIPYKLGDPIIGLNWCSYYTGKNSVTESGIIENMDIAVNIRMNEDMATSILTVAKSGNPTLPHQWDFAAAGHQQRGRKLINFSLRGVIEVAPRVNIVDLMYPLPDNSTWCRNGIADSASESEDLFIAFRLHDLKIIGKNARILWGMGCIADNAMVENVVSDGPVIIDNSLNGFIGHPAGTVIYRNSAAPAFVSSPESRARHIYENSHSTGL